ncbi:MAG TPA: enoyl-CoA hydratase/isomerase family protein, partial [Acidimicrobiia bacterium]|nr:enoyl-CoA hydratase/isomerase family protein [Acidimicrobiia bacterium]
MASPAATAEVSVVLGTPAILVDLDGPAGADLGPSVPSRAAGAPGLPAVVVGLHPSGPGAVPPGVADLVDVVVADPGPVLATVEAAPQASVTLALVLRASGSLGVADGLAVESAAYSTLQAGAEFACWRAGRSRGGADAGSPTTAAAHPGGGDRSGSPLAGAIPTDRDAERRAGGQRAPVVRLERVGDELRITLARPERHNAIDTAVRDQLVEALLVACADRSVDRVVLAGAGPSFCSGGDLGEFGSLPDPATAHLVRLTRSPARLLADLGPRLEVRIHGACMGAGIEMAAFAGRVVARPDTLISLPELHLGLIPGAGGTVSLPRRIGRHRTAELALTAAPIDAGTALAWGLVEAIEP